MAYCVNCGVELDKSLKKCPLCGTKVYHPDLNMDDMQGEQTFPKRRGEVEKVSKKDGIIFVSVLLLTIVVTCQLLNALVYHSFWWSIPVTGVGLFLWVFFMSIVFIDLITIYGTILIDAVAVGIFIFMISLVTPDNMWFYCVALPIIATIMIFLELIVLLSRKLPFSLWIGALYFFIMVACVCLTIELVLDMYIHQTVSLSWSAIVLTVCAIISVFLILILMMSRVRHNINRRLHL